MANNFFIQIVEITCKTLWKTPRKNRVKKCVKNLPTRISCVKTTFPTNFSLISHQLLNIYFTPIVQLFYPLFHNPYYNNYIIFK